MISPLIFDEWLELTLNSFLLLFQCNDRLNSVISFIIMPAFMLNGTSWVQFGKKRFSGFTQSMALTSPLLFVQVPMAAMRTFTWNPGNVSLKQVTSGSVLVRVGLKANVISFLGFL